MKETAIKNTWQDSEKAKIKDITKNTLLSWGILTEDEYLNIKRNLTRGFFPVTFRDDGGLITINVYRGTLTKEVLGKLSDGIFYYKSATVDLVQQ